ncbi:MAG: FecR domain-containing protein [Treponema sp.]|nr:FecR domain-containing protein [Treponema sp.]
MKRIISKLFLAVLLAALTCGSVFAASAKVTYVKGKVEVSRGDSWVALKVGDEVKESETVSTGFQSEVRLNYNGSVMAVPALSRVTLETLKSTSSKETVSLKVDTGAVRSKVTHTSGKKIEYEARTSVGVASVRGTDFAVFSTGLAKVFSGAIVYFDISEYIPPATDDEAEDEEPAEDLGPADAVTPADEIDGNAPKGAKVVGAGQSSTIDKDGQASDPFDEAKKRATKAKNAVGSAADKDGQASGAAGAAGAAGGSSAPQEGDMELNLKFKKKN